MKMNTAGLFAVTFYCLGLSGVVYASDLMEEAKSLIDQGLSDNAYNLLSTRELDYAGNHKFDYLLGIAALDSGRVTESTFALERVVVSNPNFAGARLDLARAYFKLGNYHAAETEFREVLAANPPLGIRQIVDSYLVQTEQRIRDAGRIFSNRAEFVFGYDNNVNTATAAEFVTGFNTIPFTLPQNVRQQGAGYAQLNLKSSYLRPLNAEWQGLLSGAIKYKEVPDLNAYDNTDVSVQVGLQRKRGAKELAFGLQAGRYYLAHEPNYIYLSSYLNWRRALQNNKVLNVFIRHMRVDYSLVKDKSNDFRQVLGGIGGLIQRPAYTLWLNAYIGQEMALAASNDGDRDIIGTSLAIGVPLRQDLILRGNLAWQQKKYHLVNAIFGLKRDEHYLSASAELDWRVSPVWGLIFKYSHSHNEANLEVFTYERHNFNITVYRSF